MPMPMPSWNFRADPRSRPGRLAALGPWLALAILMTGGPSPAVAAQITYEFGGTITPAATDPGLAQAATRFTGTFTYNPVDGIPPVEIEGDRSYLFGPAPGYPTPAAPGVDGLSLAIGGKSIVSMSGFLGLGLYEPGLGGARQPLGTPLVGTNLNINNAGGSLANPFSVTIELNNPDRTVYASLALPPTLSLADFASATISVTPTDTTGGLGSPAYLGIIDTLNPLPTPAPEPSTLVVIALGLAAWAARSRTRLARRPS